MSQDPVAIDSVGLDFIRNEPREEGVHGPGHPDNYLHEAALIGDAPSGTKYDPEQDGTFIAKSLGVHEHWNNAVDKQYSRNLGIGTGIELVSADPLACKGDFDQDGDVDGSDLYELAVGAEAMDLRVFADNFGRDGCP
jgi:hypothetical protein